MLVKMISNNSHYMKIQNNFISREGFHIIHALKLTSFESQAYAYILSNHFENRLKDQINIIKCLKHNHIRNFKTPILQK